MRHARHQRRAYLLLHVVAMLPIAALLLLVLGKLLLDSFYVQRVAAEHARIVAAGESLAARLRADALATTRWALCDDRLRLETVTPDGPTTVEYRLSRERVERVGATRAEQHWAAPRLHFAWRVEAGSAGSVLWVDLNQSLPARKTAVLVKSVRASALLPAQAAPAVAVEVEP